MEQLHFTLEFIPNDELMSLHKTKSSFDFEEDEFFENIEKLKESVPLERHIPRSIEIYQEHI